MPVRLNNLTIEIDVYKKRALISAFFLLFGSSVIYADNHLCPIVGYGESIRVLEVIDGESFTLVDGVRVRIIGIEAPKEDNKYPERSQPGAEESKLFLQKLIKPGDVVNLFFDKRNQDRYGRTLAHVRLQNKTNIAASILQNGQAQALVLPPNLKYWQCYQDIEQKAQKDSVGIWRFPFYGSKSTDKLTKNISGNFRLHGKITQRKSSNRYLWYGLDDKIWLGVKKNDLNYFPNYYFDDFIGETVDVRGWVYFSHNSFRMRIRHPQQITKLQPH